MTLRTLKITVNLQIWTTLKKSMKKLHVSWKGYGLWWTILFFQIIYMVFALSMAQIQTLPQQQCVHLSSKKKVILETLRHVCSLWPSRQIHLDTKAKGSWICRKGNCNLQWLLAWLKSGCSSGSQFLSHLTKKWALCKGHMGPYYCFLVNNIYEALQLGEIVCYANDSYIVF
jgi:hypothetical protein